jgi:hypothetical protein
MPDDIDIADDATESEVKSYEMAYRETRLAIDESIELLALLQNFEMDADKQSAIGEKLLKLEGRRKDLLLANLAFHTGNAVMSPPSSGLMDEIVANTKQVVELTVERATASAVLKIATRALTKFAEIQNIDSG